MARKRTGAPLVAALDPGASPRKRRRRLSVRRRLCGVIQESPGQDIECREVWLHCEPMRTSG